MSQPFILALVGLCGTFGGALIAMLAGMVNNNHNFRLNETTRQLDLYKIAYPELVDASKNVSKATRLMELKLSYFINYQKGMEADVRANELLSLQQQILDTTLLTASYEWLLTDESNEAASNFNSMCQTMIEYWAEVDKNGLEILSMGRCKIVICLHRQLHMSVVHNFSFDEEHTCKQLWRHRGNKPNSNKSLGIVSERPRSEAKRPTSR